jgi:predicted RNA-binding protein with TRAM domain
LKIKKQIEYPSLHIEAISSEGLGIAKPEGKVVFVEAAIPGDEVSVKIVQAKKAFEQGKIIEILAFVRILEYVGAVNGNMPPMRLNYLTKKK